MNIGLYGGSFDPIHYGHILPVREAREALALDRVIYLPTANPPHKIPPGGGSSIRPPPGEPERGAAPALARYAMVELALLAEEDFLVSTFELGGHVAYTVDTLEHFRRRHPDARLFLILGSDSLLELDTWRQWRKILELAELAVLTRPGARSDQMPRELRDALDDARVHRIENSPVAVSSTEIRRRITARTNDLRRLLPSLVLDYVDKYELYR